jgi:DedD protein
MAFFKFRFPGQNAASSNEGASAGSADSLEVVRRRARYRLIGAVVLVFVAVVAFPFLFDTQPRPVAVDTPILIPDRDNTPPLVAAKPVPAAQAPAKPLLSGASVVSPQASLDAGKEEVVLPNAAPASAAVNEPKPAASVPAKPAASAQTPPAAAASVPSKPAPTAAKADKPAPTKPANDGAKAKALLEGKPAASEHTKVTLQVGAFSDADKVREVRRKLEQAGLKTYIQVVEGKDGKKTTRVRVGPYDTRAEADKAAARIRKLDLPASVLNH